jgi:hypothetical protein
MLDDGSYSSAASALTLLIAIGGALACIQFQESPGGNCDARSSRFNESATIATCEAQTVVARDTLTATAVGTVLSVYEAAR